MDLELLYSEFVSVGIFRFDEVGNCFMEDWIVGDVSLEASQGPKQKTNISCLTPGPAPIT